MKINRIAISMCLAAACISPEQPVSARAKQTDHILIARSQNLYAAYPTERLYREAQDLLRKGKRFTGVAERLHELIRREPGNAHYQADLGCAYAGRATSLGFAASQLPLLAGDQAKYRKYHLAWEDAQRGAAEKAVPPLTASSVPDQIEVNGEVQTLGDKEKSVYLEVMARLREQEQNYIRELLKKGPPAPPVLRTRDDLLPFTLDLEQTKVQFGELSKRATDAWDAAVEKAGPEDLAQMRTVRAWGLLLLYRHALLIDLTGSPQREAVLDAFTQMTRWYPDDPKVWSAMGDAVIYARPKGVDFNTATFEEAEKSYRESLKRSPKQADLWFCLFEFHQSFHMGTTAENSDLLRRACDADRGNAFPQYCLAMTLAGDDVPDTGLGAALEALRVGGQCAAYKPLKHRSIPPPQFEAPWAYLNPIISGVNGTGFRWSKPTKRLCAYVWKRAKKTDRAETQSVLEAVKKMGSQMWSVLPEDTIGWKFMDSFVAMSSDEITNTAYRYLISLHRLFTEEELANGLAQEKQTINKRNAERFMSVSSQGFFGYKIK